MTADTIATGDHVSYLDPELGRVFGWVLGTRRDGRCEVSAGYHGVAVLAPYEITWEEH
jgi:hypothetical protein